jgi:hypothetical protein
MMMTEKQDDMFQIIGTDATYAVSGYRAFFKQIQTADFKAKHIDQELAMQRMTKDGWKTIMVFKVS